MKTKPLRVSEVNQYIKRVFSSDWILSDIKVEGEVSNFKHHYSGHMYFSLKDDKSKIKCVMFKSNNQFMDCTIKDGDKIIVYGYVSVYEREGNYQLYVKEIEKSGIGELYETFEKLKNKLEKEGLFDEEYKKEIPSFSRKIGVVTSSTGAAIRDIITVINRRFSIADIVIYPALVQGLDAPQHICEGLEYFNNREDIDVVIIGRGGGSMEELFAFNDEQLARTIFQMNKPVVSAVGHETDFTISDFVSDMRAPTPSAAAEIVTPDINELIDTLEEKYSQLNKCMNYIINDKSLKLKYISKSLQFYNPVNNLRDKAQELDEVFKNLIMLMNVKLKSSNNKIEHLNNALKYLNPLNALDRGYAIISELDGKLITSVDSVSAEKYLDVMMKDGIIRVKVVNINKGDLEHGN